MPKAPKEKLLPCIRTQTVEDWEIREESQREKLSYLEGCYFSKASGEENIIHQMAKNNTMEYWKEEAKKNSDVVSAIKETKTKHLYHILTLVSIRPAAF